jgi:hypothetical protein
VYQVLVEEFLKGAAPAADAARPADDEWEW